MSEQLLEIDQMQTIEDSQQTSYARDTSSWTLKDWFSASVQPTLVLGSIILVAYMAAIDWIHLELFAVIMILLPVPLCFIAERIWTKRQDWLLEPKEMVEDVFWLACGAFIWVPFYTSFYETPISAGFKAVRDMAPLQITLDPTSFIGYFGSAMTVMVISSFIYYWLHRIQHESLFWWRIHATHHHITKMGCMRGDRTHPIEWATLFLGAPIALSLLGASDGVLEVVGAFSMWSGTLNHSNLPLKSMPVYDWFFATAQQHHVHHAHLRRQADSNYGCNIILWDRLFGTYCGDAKEGQIGAGKAVPLSIKDQFLLAFYPDDKLKGL